LPQDVMCQEANHFSHGKATYMTGLLIGSLFGGAVSDRLVFPPFFQKLLRLKPS